MKRYLVFAGENYYPGGGWHDIPRGSKQGFDSEDEAILCARQLVDALSLDIDWAHVADTQTGTVVWDSEAP